MFVNSMSDLFLRFGAALAIGLSVHRQEDGPSKDEERATTGKPPSQGLAIDLVHPTATPPDLGWSDQRTQMGHEVGGAVARA